jgi:hypothetical protein
MPGVPVVAAVGGLPRVAVVGALPGARALVAGAHARVVGACVVPLVVVHQHTEPGWGTS